MNDISVIRHKNAEVTIKGILARAAARGAVLSRDEVLEDLKWNEAEDVSVWGATVDRLMGVTA